MTSLTCVLSHVNFQVTKGRKFVMAYMTLIFLLSFKEKKPPIFQQVCRCRYILVCGLFRHKSHQGGEGGGGGGGGGKPGSKKAEGYPCEFLQGSFRIL